MFTELKEVVVRSRNTLIEDAIGMIALFSLLIAALVISGAA